MNADEGINPVIEEILGLAYHPDEPGAAAIVVKDGQVLFRKAYGLANLELGVPMRPDYIFRIGSITKQFTAVAILLLVQEGKLALDEEIGRFLPDYPTHGHRITVEHLLTHTSGIKSYTDRPDLRDLMRKDVTLPELVGEFRDLPMEFAPGERFKYSNSGYILLGAIVEAVSGRTYEQLLTERIIRPLDLGHTEYDHSERILPGRAAGYDKTPDGYQNAAFLSMTQPHAAGALLSTVDDLARWDAALDAGRLVSRSLLERAWTPYRLNDGRSTSYGYGWALGSYEGRRTIEHGGGIPGFITQAIRLPEDQVFVALLTNSAGKEPSPAHLAMKVAALAIGKPYDEPTPVALSPDALDAYVGVYQTGEKEKRTVTRDGESLSLQWGNGPKREILPISAAEFFPRGDSFVRIHFTLIDGAAPTTLEIRHRTWMPEVARRIEKAE